MRFSSEKSNSQYLTDHLSLCLWVCRSVGPSVRRFVGLGSLSACQCVGLLDCRSVGLSGCRSSGLSVCRSVSLSVGRTVGLSDCRSVGRRTRSVSIVGLSVSRFCYFADESFHFGSLEGSLARFGSSRGLQGFILGALQLSEAPF